MTQRTVTIANNGRGRITVHKPGCADLKRGQAVTWEATVTCQRDVILDIYQGFEGMEADGTGWEDFTDDVHFMPCLGEPLPEVPQDVEPTLEELVADVTTEHIAQLTARLAAGERIEHDGTNWTIRDDRGEWVANYGNAVVIAAIRRGVVRQYGGDRPNTARPVLRVSPRAARAIHIGTFRESCASHGCPGCPPAQSTDAPAQQPPPAARTVTLTLTEQETANLYDHLVQYQMAVRGIERRTRARVASGLLAPVELAEHNARLTEAAEILQSARALSDRVFHVSAGCCRR